MAHKRTGRHAGPLSREERRIAYQTAQEARERGPEPLYGPPTPKGLGGTGKNWGGARAGSGRKRKDGGADQWLLVRIPFQTKLLLEALPEGAMSEYLRKAVDLMVHVVAPEKYKLKPEPEEEKANSTGSR